MTERVLVVDDHEAKRYAIKRVLEADGLVVEEASSGEEALQIAQRTLPDLVVLDVKLPDIDGIDVCARLKGAPRTRGVAVVHVSANRVSVEDRIAGYAAGAEGYLVDPYDPRELVALVRSILRAREGVRGSEAAPSFDGVAQDRLRAVAELGQILGLSFDVELMLDSLAHLVVPRLADGCVVHAMRGETLELAAVVDADETREARAKALFEAHRVDHESPHGLARVVRTREPQLVPHVDVSTTSLLGGKDGHAEIIQAVDARSLLAVPLAAGTIVHGVLSVFNRGERRAFDEDDRGFFVEVGRQAGLAIDNARLVQQTREAVNARQELLAFVSHDLKNPLTAIMMNAALIKRGSKDVTRHADVILRAADRMERLVADLLDIASVEAGKLVLHFGEHDAGKLVHESLELLEPLASRKSIALERDVEPAMLCCDRERVLRVLSNLVGNAIKFTPEKGRIEVRARAVDDHVQFCIIDSGPGIPPEARAHVFERYWRARETKQKGTGLGLAIAKAIVDAHKGRIWVGGHAPRGTTITFELPVRQRGSDAGKG